MSGISGGGIIAVNIRFVLFKGLFRRLVALPAVVDVALQVLLLLLVFAPSFFPLQGKLAGHDTGLFPEHGLFEGSLGEGSGVCQQLDGRQAVLRLGDWDGAQRRLAEVQELGRFHCGVLGVAVQGASSNRGGELGLRLGT